MGIDGPSVPDQPDKPGEGDRGDVTPSSFIVGVPDGMSDEQWATLQDAFAARKGTSLGDFTPKRKPSITDQPGVVLTDGEQLPSDFAEEIKYEILAYFPERIVEHLDDEQLDKVLLATARDGLPADVRELFTESELRELPPYALEGLSSTVFDGTKADLSKIFPAGYQTPHADRDAIDNRTDTS